MDEITDEQIAKLKLAIYNISKGDFDATDDEARQIAIALQPSPSLRDEALEEAATLCVHLAAGLWADDMRFKQAAGANECAGRIRALIGTKPLAALSRSEQTK